MKKMLIYFLVVLILSGCTNNDDTVKTLRQAGYTNIQTHGYAFFACSKDDFSATEFTAITQNGVQASGAVCCGLIFKNCTIRF